MKKNNKQAQSDFERREALINSLLPEDDRGLGKAYDTHVVRRLGAFIRPYNKRLFTAIFLMITMSLLSVAGPKLVGLAVDEGVLKGDYSQLRFWTILYIISAAGVWITNRARINIMAFVGSRVVADTRSAMFRHLQTMSMNFYNNYSVGRLISRLISDVGVMEDFITWSITGLVRAVFLLIGILIAMFLTNWKLATVIVILLPPMVLIARYWQTHAHDTYSATRRRLALINGYLNESISGIRVTKSFVREGANSTYFNDLNRGYFDSQVKAAQLTAFFFPSIDTFGALGSALVVIVGGWLMLQGEMSAGELLAFLLYVTRFFDPIRQLAQRFNSFQAMMAAGERIFALLDTEPDLLDSAEAYPLPPINGHVVLKNVSFHYKVDEPVLSDISIDAQPGQRIALVGETGAGKSTIIRLLSRFFDVTDGAITIDGHDLRQVTRKSLRSQFGIVLQDTFLFSGTVLENIRYGKLEASDEEVMAAAKAVGADTFIMRSAEGYQTDVGENGVNLSVGQRQIISFARALLADPNILILDEATSSVDTTSERQIQAAIETLLTGRTSFVIAHRLSTIVNADKIVVLHNGKIAEMGSHEALLAQRGRYFNLYTMQWAAR